MIKYFLSSSILSDILDDLYHETNIIHGQVITGFKTLNIENKIFGKAKTIRLRKLKENEDYRGIYKALDSYEFLVNNDVLVVENEANNYANLSIRNGVSGVIVDGATRDINSVSRLELPVLYKSLNPCDVRIRAAVDYINRPIKINGEILNSGDLIFADNEGVIIIKQEYKNKGNITFYSEEIFPLKKEIT